MLPELMISSITSAITKMRSSPVLLSTEDSTSVPMCAFSQHRAEAHAQRQAVLQKCPSSHQEIRHTLGFGYHSIPIFAATLISVVPAPPHVPASRIGESLVELGSLASSLPKINKTSMRGTSFHASVALYHIHPPGEYLCACGVKVTDNWIRETESTEILQSPRLWARHLRKSSQFCVFDYVRIRGCIVSSSMEEERHEKGARGQILQTCEVPGLQFGRYDAENNFWSLRQITRSMAASLRDKGMHQRNPSRVCTCERMG
ncbi:hypothetical protein EDD85DRAFT_228878 [Armillaria nabsnona]|nr:hypothetical protein EDD85DRAFT_228878 [Armillaria nabsnona]